MSIVLASLLIGVGYDAYVVIGFAEKRICLADEAHEPLVGHSRSRTSQGSSRSKKAQIKVFSDDAKEESVYSVKQRPVLDSTFVMTRDKFDRLDQELTKKEQEAPAMLIEEEEQSVQEEDEYEGQRVHAWVLVRAGKREMVDNVFVEASTGKVVPTNHPGYKGIEAVFNHQNYWVDMQRVDEPKDISFALEDFNKWEFLFISSMSKDQRRNSIEDARPNRSPPSSPLEGKRVGTGNRRPAGQEGGAGQDDQRVEGPEEVAEGEHILDLPPSWVDKLFIDREIFLRRYAEESGEPKRTKDYKKSRVEHFAENSRRDGMTEMITLYSDLARTNMTEIQEYFANRKDKLVSRFRYFRTGKRIDSNRKEHMIFENFDPGRPDALMKLVEKPEGREFTFYHKATLDGMVNRTESFTRNRDPAKPVALHKVYHTSITFEPIEPNTDAPPMKQQIDHPRKMTEKFERNPEVPADKDIAKRTFFTGSRPPRIHLIFHYGPGRITSSTRTYITEKNLSGDEFSVQEYVVDPFAKPMRYTEQRDEYQLLTAAEKSLISEFREAEREATKILESREKEEKEPGLLKSLHVQLQEKKVAEAMKPKEEESEAALKYDYLAPYLPKHAKQKALTKQDAQKVKDSCLKALKERLIDRAHIIETRLEEEQAALTKKQVGYQRQDKDKTSDDEEYEKYVNEAQFRIQILKQRRDRHEEIAKAKFKEMIERLQNDPRLAILNQ
ncbi:hypothetical protein GUITHDRAFT_100003 [Guillardia theta CCMP2712]|uniref:Uncharacterized protein n=1 Tax=Guillardia theta (strain CCMP2712) TaxID=905079 RepID=L1K106_GUITC|nr:hypothetical protein GUITHDRAFT_100003 [Guillardia theta CCMP2712]EKX54526.1 hypothetical protein GUITHDRAFT_100003 [Guillardia theta CCMP2712]|eukprot:XP_005841506.1 hypothetical protein GUITHDRAFT_100003 [Guillardia theta CCMP2712]